MQFSRETCERLIQNNLVEMHVFVLSNHLQFILIDCYLWLIIIVIIVISRDSNYNNSVSFNVIIKTGSIEQGCSKIEIENTLASSSYENKEI